MSALDPFTDVPRDLRLAVRSLVRAPQLAVASLLVVALGVGPNAALFSLVDALLVRPLPVPEAERLVRVYPGSETVSYPDFLVYRDHFRREGGALEGLAVERGVGLALHAGERPERIVGALVSDDYFDVLGVEPVLGRTFLADGDGAPGGHPVAVISHATWQRRFAGSPEVLGATLRLNRHRFTVVGVAPAGFTGTTLGQQPEVWVPMSTQPVVWPGRDRLTDRTRNGLSLLGRLAPGASAEQARSEVTVLYQRLRQRFEDGPGGWTDARVEPAGLLHREMRRPVAAFSGLLAVVVGLVLLIACGNLANLLLARGAGRQREMAVYRALGAGRGSLVRRLLAENLLLSLAGGLLGLLLAALLLPVFLRAQLAALPVPVSLDLRVTGRVLAATLGVSLLTGVLAGLVPALRATRGDLVTPLKEDPRTRGRGGARSTPRDLLVVGQVGLSLLLLVGAGLFVRSLAEAHRVDPGFDVEGILVATVDPAGAGLEEGEGVAYVERLLQRVRSVPGVEAVGLSSLVPLSLDNQSLAVSVAGEPRGQVFFNRVGPGYFRASGIPLLRGRGFTPRDRLGSPPVAVVNRAFVQAHLGGRDPLGRDVQQHDFDGPSPRYRIVGLVDNSKYLTLGEADRPLLYLAAAQQPSPGPAHLHVRLSGERGVGAGTREALEEVLRGVDPDVPVDLRTMEEHLGVAYLLPRLGASLLAAFGGLGMLLAVLGIYGTLSYLVEQRRREIGIRMALGGDRGRILALVLRRGLGLTAAGVAVGLLLALLVTRLLAGLLYGVSPLDPWVFTGVPVLLLAVAAVAALLPARRAAAADPAVALRG